MQYDTHVYLGPTLDLATAEKYLGKAHYHPPIQCGDLIRLLRLKPKRVLIIDGLYESVPAVWHKEIMVLLSLQIPVYGAASMGALRAAELYHYGMKGIGKIFEDFAQGQLFDDDEVAVLHRGKEENYSPVNDAMVNIRATCELAHLENKLNQEEKKQLIDFCKKQFYPYRSLKEAIKQHKLNQDFIEWFRQHGVIDLKKQDAIFALKQIQTLIAAEVMEENQAIELPATKFITSLIDEVEGTAFSFEEPWLPDIEKQLYHLSMQNPAAFGLINKIALLIKQSSSLIANRELSEVETSLNYIRQHQLYLPGYKPTSLEQSPVLCKLYAWLLQQIGIHQISKQQIETYAATLTVYFNLKELNNVKIQNLLELIVLLVILNYLQLGDDRLKIKQDAVSHHLQECGFWFRYRQHKQEQRINLHAAIDFIAIYMQVSYIYQGFRDVALGQPSLPNYFNWIYDALIIYEGTQNL